MQSFGFAGQCFSLSDFHTRVLCVRPRLDFSKRSQCVSRIEAALVDSRKSTSDLRTDELGEPMHWLSGSVLPWDSACTAVPRTVLAAQICPCLPSQRVALLRCRQVIVDFGRRHPHTALMNQIWNIF